MRVAHLSLRNFRNYREAEVSFDRGCNLIIGRNGQGKTNLVEAIAYFATLGSHRVSSDSALIRSGEEEAIARMRVSVGERDALLEVELNRSKPNRSQVNGNPVRAREVTRWFAAVVFAPEDLSIVRGEPAGRRRFLDEAMSALNPAVHGVLQDYERVVRQRNSLLKTAKLTGKRSAVDATLGVWDDQLAELGSRIMWERRQLVRRLLDPLRAAYTTLAGEDHGAGARLTESATPEDTPRNVSRETQALGAPNQPHPPEDVSRETLRADFAAALERVRALELDRGVTLVGPQRDDLELLLNDLPVRGYASHGESWSFALSLRLAVARLLREDSVAGDPVIILDDVFAELDAGRRSRLLSTVSEFEQVLITVAVEEDVPTTLVARRIAVDHGVVLGPPAGGGESA